MYVSCRRAVEEEVESRRQWRREGWGESESSSGSKCCAVYMDWWLTFGIFWRMNGETGNWNSITAECWSWRQRTNKRKRQNVSRLPQVTFQYYFRIALSVYFFVVAQSISWQKHKMRRPSSPQSSYFFRIFFYIVRDFLSSCLWHSFH